MTKYVAGWNMPGYLPEMEPAEFNSFDEAKQFIIDELKEQENHSVSWPSEPGYPEQAEDDATMFCHEAEDINLESTPFTTQLMPDGYVYWVDVNE